MRRTIVSFGLILALTGSVVLTQSVDEFDTWMRTIDEKNQSVQTIPAIRQDEVKSS